MHYIMVVCNKKKSGNMFFAQMKLGLILPAGCYLFSLLETFRAVPFLCNGRRAVSHLADPDSPLQTKGWNCLECCFSECWDSFFLFPFCVFAPAARCRGIEESVLNNGLKGLRRTTVF